MAGQPPLCHCVILVVVTGALLLSASRGRFADPRDLAVGNCLYVRTSTAQDETQPIGDARTVGEAVLAGNAETAGCGASHGHEVSALIDLTPLHYQYAEAQAACSQAFQPYVGHTIEGSRYLTFAAVPTAEQLAAGANVTICLVARADGQWMDHPARDSGGIGAGNLFLRLSGRLTDAAGALRAALDPSGALPA